ncbi:MAG: hypothetical protein HQM08_09750 [Candidatus Riflebacteria bacterium]|nr:hypothetical protein [Candidatus Riflebacteria bacterium]
MSKKSGFTIMELVVGACVMTLVLFSIYELFHSGTKGAGSGILLLNEIKEMSRISSFVENDVLRCRKITCDIGPIIIQSSRDDISGLIADFMNKTGKTILESNSGSQIVYNVINSSDRKNQSCIERCEEPAQSGIAAPQSKREFANGLVKEFCLIPIERRPQSGSNGTSFSTRCLLLHMVLSDNSKNSLSKREFKLDTIFCPGSQPSCTWNVWEEKK